MKRILFVCSQNKWRSPTAESVFSNYPDCVVRSAGTNHDAEIPLGLEDVLWAEYIFVMENVHLAKIKRNFSTELKNKKIICLDIPDKYHYMDEELVRLLKEKIHKYIKVDYK